MKYKVLNLFRRLRSKSSFEEIYYRIKLMRDKLGSIETYANPFFSVVKPTEENMRKYRIVFSNSYFVLILCIIFLPISIFFNLLWTILVFFLKKLYRRELPTSALLSNIDNFYLSHLTQTSSKNVSDRFFSNQNNNLNSFTLYLNHLAFFGRHIKQINRNYLPEHFEISNSNLSFKDLMSALRRQISQVFTLIGMIRLLESKDILTFRLFLRALSFESSRRTTHNILLLRRIRTLVETMEPKFLFLTAEGQPFESLVIRMRDLHFPKMRICYVQHSPIVPGQMELFENLSLLRKGDLVEVTGVYYKELFSYYNRDLEFKFKKTSSPQTLNQNEFTVNDIHILGAPEASFSSTLRFLLLFCELSTKFREWTFVIRFHPDLRRQGLMKNIFPRFCRNLYFSNQSLHFDLQTSNFVIFRSSSVGIEALGFGVIPIHISFENSRLLNPLQNTFFDRFSFNETQSIIDFFSQFQDSKADLRKLQLNSASTYRLFRSY